MITKKYGNIEVNFHCKKEELKITHVIYILKFPNNKYYVGQTNTKFGLVSRIQGHCYESYNKRKKRNVYKDNIIRKYKKFDVFVAHRCTLENIDEFEIFYINILKNHIVNLESGGCINKTHSENTKKKMSEKIRKYQKEHPKILNIMVYDLKGNFIRSHKTKAEVKDFYGANEIEIDNALYYKGRIFLKKYQIFRKGYENVIDYTKRIDYSNNRPKRKANNPDETIFKYDPISGEFIGEVKIGETDSDKRFYIKQMIKRNALYDGFAWSLEKHDFIVPPKSRYEKVSEKLSKPVLQLDDELNVIKRWKNNREAGKYYNIRPELIRQVCIRWRRHAKGFVWCFENEYEWFKTMWGEKLVRKR